jgi:hypothetical protein
MMGRSSALIALCVLASRNSTISGERWMTTSNSSVVITSDPAASLSVHLGVPQSVLAIAQE